MSAVPTLVLVDGSSYLYRAFHALPPLNNSRGEPTGAVLGVLNMLNKLIREQAPQLIAIVFDAPGRTFRDDLFTEYKAHRKPMPDDMRPQIDPLMQAVEAMGLPMLRIEGVEADDVIGTLARCAAREGIRVIISTGDKDMAQLVDERTTLVNTMTGSVLDREGVKAKFDVYPEQIVDYLALVGDSSDNIPGVPKVGAKTAAKWLGEYGTLDNLIANAASITAKVGESLRENLTAVELSRKLATIDCDVKLDFGPRDLQPRAPALGTLRELYKRLELNSLLRQLSTEAGAPAAGAASATTPETESVSSTPIPAARPQAPRDYETVASLEVFRQWLAAIKSAPLFALDVHTNTVDYMNAEIVGIAFAIEPGRAAYVPVGHRYPGAPDQLDRTQVL